MIATRRRPLSKIFSAQSIAALFASFSIASAAHAGLVTTSLGPDQTIAAGGTATLMLDIGFTPTGGYNYGYPYHCYNNGYTCSALTDYADPSYLTSLSVTVNSGAGQTETFSGLGLFTVNFTYANAGHFDVTVSGTSSENQFADYYYFEQDYYSYECGWFSRCTGYNDYSNGPGGYTQSVNSSVDPSNAWVTVTADAVPEPASLALFGAGLAGFGWLRRRKAA